MEDKVRPEDLKPIEIYAQIDMSVSPNEVRVRPTWGNPWSDFGLWLEATSFMARMAANQKEMTDEEIVKYAADYIAKGIKDYKKKPL